MTAAAGYCYILRQSRNQTDSLQRLLLLQQCHKVARLGSGQDVGLVTFASLVRLPVMTLLGYF